MTTLIITIPMLMFFTSTTSHVNLRRVVYNEGRDSLCCVHEAVTFLVVQDHYRKAALLGQNCAVCFSVLCVFLYIDSNN